MKTNKRYSLKCRNHAQRRALERYGLIIGKHGLDFIAGLIQKGKSRPHPYLKSTATRSVHIIDYQGQRLAVVYSKTLKQIVTVLPWDERILTVEAEAERS